MKKLFYDDENIIGYSDEIIKDIKENMKDMDENDKEVFNELIEELERYDYELVVCYYHPMGAYHVSKLKEEES